MMNETVLAKAAQELEELKRHEQRSTKINSRRTSDDASKFIRFPQNCLKLLFGIPGNYKCIDCNASNPQWATISYGALLCIECSGRHRHMGVETSTVRSITMDSWKHSEVLAMLEGGNKQVGDFFARHMLKSSNRDTYRTNAAKFYKQNLKTHVSKIKSSGIYKGRSSYRNSPPSPCRVQQRSLCENNNSSEVYRRRQIIVE